MEAFKFAFETIIIGILALPWLAMLIDLALTEPLTLSRMDRFIRELPGESAATILGVALLTLSYLMGSAISPVAAELLNDEDWIGHVLPTERQIQVRAYFAGMAQGERDRFCRVNTNTDGLCAADAVPQRNVDDSRNPGWKLLLQDFELEESSLQLRGTDKVEAISRLHERLTVLRGATFSAILVLMLIVFALCSSFRGKQKDQPRALNKFLSWIAVIPAASLVVLALRYGVEDFLAQDVNDMPIMETVLLFFGAFGLYLWKHPIEKRAYVRVSTCLLAMFFAVFVYGGYIWTEVNYDEAVHHAYVADRIQPSLDEDASKLRTAHNDPRADGQLEANNKLGTHAHEK